MDDAKIKNFIVTARAKGIPDPEILAFVKQKQTEQAKAVETIGYSNTGQELVQTGKDIVGTVKETGQKIADAQRMSMSGEQSPLESGFQMAGAVASGVSGLVGDVVKGGVQAVLPQEAENAVKAGIATGVQKASDVLSKYENLKQTKPALAGAINLVLGSAPEATLGVIDLVKGYEKLKTTNPRLARNLDSALGIGELALDVATLGGSKVAVTAGKEVVEQGAKAAGRQAAKVAGEVATQAGKAGAKVGEMAGSVAKVAGDVIPSRQQLVSDQLTKALDLTQGDVSNILLSTGNDVGEFIARNSLIKGNKNETVAAVKELTDKQYKVVRDNIKQVTKDYSSQEIADVKKSLSVLKKEVKDVPGLEKVYAEVVALGNKSAYKLEDVQKIKELLDDQFSLYKATGDVKDVTKAKGLANVRKSLKEFIEKEVRDTTGADIAQLNNDVATGKSIINLANKRSTRGLTRANVSLSDLGAFAGGSAIGSPLVGAAALVVKRIAESPTIRLKVADFLNSLGKTEKAAIKKQLLSGEAPESIKKIVSQARGIQPSAKSTKISTANASIPKASTKTATKSKDLSTDLVNEAKKYKSAEDFIKSQGTPVYHGTRADFNEFDIKKAGQTDRGFAGKGIYFTNDSQMADFFAKGQGDFKTGGRVIEANLNIKNPLVIEANVKNPYQKLQDMLGAKNSDDIPVKAKQLGYDSVIIKDKTPEGRIVDEYVVFDTSKIKTKQQLQDIWNKANKK